MTNSSAPSPDVAAVRQQYLLTLAAQVGEDPLYIERKFISDDKWRKYSGTESFRYSGVLREQEPNLKKLLVHRHLVIVGEPGSGKSTIARAVARLLGSQDSVVAVPIIVNLRSYRGDLKNLYRTQIPSSLLESQELKRHYILDGLDEVPHEALQGAFRDVKGLLTADPGCNLIITWLQSTELDRRTTHTRHPHHLSQIENTKPTRKQASFKSLYPKRPQSGACSTSRMPRALQIQP